jgi:hypothetical protein
MKIMKILTNGVSIFIFFFFFFFFFFYPAVFAQVVLEEF